MLCMGCHPFPQEAHHLGHILPSLPTAAMFKLVTGFKLRIHQMTVDRQFSYPLKPALKLTSQLYHKDSNEDHLELLEDSRRCRN